MDFAYNLHGGTAPVMKRYQIAATVPTPGVPLLVPAASAAGLALGTTTGAVGMVGVAVDSAVFISAQNADGSAVARTVLVIISPDAVYRAKLSGGATENTPLALQPITVLSADGLTITTGTDWSSPQFDEGVVWGYDGSNAGQIRKITATSVTAGVVNPAFDRDTVVTENFLRAPYWYMQTANVQLTTGLTQANAIIAAGTGAGFRVIDMELNDVAGDGRNNSWIHMMPTDHVLKG